jgi:hypothetical protein
MLLRHLALAVTDEQRSRTGYVGEAAWEPSP